MKKNQPREPIGFYIEEKNKLTTLQKGDLISWQKRDSIIAFVRPHTTGSNKLCIGNPNNIVNHHDNQVFMGKELNEDIFIEMARLIGIASPSRLYIQKFFEDEKLLIYEFI